MRLLDHLARTFLVGDAHVNDYDPEGMEASGAWSVRYLRQRSYEVTENADAVVMVTEWNEFPNLKRLKEPPIVDLGNVYPVVEVTERGPRYFAVRQERR